jgi:hypothetical protein
MKTDTCVVRMRKIRNPYTKYEGGGRRPAPSHNDSIRATDLSKAVVDCGKRSPEPKSARVVHKINFRVLPLSGWVGPPGGPASPLWQRRGPLGCSACAQNSHS